MSLQEECDEIQQAVTNNNMTVLWELIIKGVDINNAEVYSDVFEVSDVKW